MNRALLGDLSQQDLIDQRRNKIPVMELLDMPNDSSSLGANEIFFNNTRIITGLYIYPCLCFFGIFTNIVGICILVNIKQTSANIYIIFLSISDIVKILVDVLYFVAVLAADLGQTDLGNSIFETLYPYAHYLFQTSMCISAWLTTFLAIDRFVCVCKSKSPFKNRHCTPSKAKKICICVYIGIAVISFPYVLRYEHNNVVNSTEIPQTITSISDLWQNNTFTSVFIWIQFTIKTVVPLTILLIVVPCIIYHIRQCQRVMVRFRVTVTMCVVILIFVICMVPDAVLSAAFCIGYKEEGYFGRGIREITDTLILFNASINTAVYCSSNSEFREKLKAVMSGRCCSQERRYSLVSQRSSVTRNSVTMIELHTVNNMGVV